MKISPCLMRHPLPFIVMLLSSFTLTSQTDVSGIVKNRNTSETIPYISIVLKIEADSSFAAGTITNEEGRFILRSVKPGKYLLEASFMGYQTNRQPLFVGTLSSFLDIGVVFLRADATILNEIEITSKQDEAGKKLDKTVIRMDDNISQNGGTVLQALQNVSGVTVQDGKIQLRGNDKVTVLIDGKQTALTGFGNQSSLDNIPASSIEKIEIINNPSAKHDANGNAGIVNIIYRKNQQQGFNGKAGINGGLGALWVKKNNLPRIRPQYQYTPKVNPSLSLNYRKNKMNAFFQGAFLWTQTLNKNEFVDRYYDDGNIIRQQTKRNRNTTVATVKTGLDWSPNEQDQLAISALSTYERILDRGDQPFYNYDLTDQKRLWQFLEDELKKTVTTSAAYIHKIQTTGTSIGCERQLYLPQGR